MNDEIVRLKKKQVDANQTNIIRNNVKMLKNFNKLKIESIFKRKKDLAQRTKGVFEKNKQNYEDRLSVRIKFQMRNEELKKLVEEEKIRAYENYKRFFFKYFWLYLFKFYNAMDLVMERF